MIADLFIKILNLSIGAVPIMAALLVLRLLFKKAVPRKVFYIAWALVFLRLMVPFSLESNLSIFNHVPKAEVVEENIGTSVIFVENSGTTVDFPVLNHPSADNPNTDAPDVTEPETELEKPSDPVISVAKIDKNHIYGTVWIFGTAGLFLFGIIGYFAVLKKTKFESVPYTENIRLSDFFKTPIVCGLIRPKIILPMNFDLDDDAKVKSVIAHECTHIRRGDNFWRLLASFTLYVHWFNPLVWICYDAFIRDMEVSCDEEVLGKSESDIRGEYAESLVSLSGSGTNPLYGGVLSFGESGIKERVKCIMNFKRATLLIVIICVAVAAALGVIFLTNPSAIGEENQSVSYEVFETENSNAVYSQEKGLEIEVFIKNTDNKTIWLGPSTYIYTAVDGNKNQFAGVYSNGGVLMIRKGDEALFCDTIPAEKFHESLRYDLPAGEYILEREVYFDEGLTPTGLYAEFHFEIRKESNFVNSLANADRKGDIVTLGNYYGEIEWLVLDVKDDNLLLITLDCIDALPYNNERKKLTWENSDIRKWLNEDFIETAFSEEEKDLILTTELENPDNKRFGGAIGGNITEDKIFFLSHDEVLEYFPNGWNIHTEPTVKAEKELLKLNIDGRENWWWWTRSPGLGQDMATVVNGVTLGVGDDGLPVNEKNGIRPTMWINKNGLSKEEQYRKYGDKVFFSGDFSGKVLSGNIAEKFIPATDFPTEQHLAASNMAEHYSNMFNNLSSGVVPSEISGLTLVFQPNDRNYVINLGEYKARCLIGMLSQIEVKSTTKSVNPNTGGGIEIYLEQKDEDVITRIQYDGRLVISQEGDKYANVFDGEICENVFWDIQNFAEEMISGAKEYIEDGSAPEENQNKLGKYLVPINTETVLTIFNNTDKTAAKGSYSDILKQLLNRGSFTKKLKENELDELGNALEGVDVVEFARTEDGKKYTLSLYENGFIINGSAVSDDEKNQAYLVHPLPWGEFKNVSEQAFTENKKIPYWFGLINEKNVLEASVKYGNTTRGIASELSTEKDCLSELISRLRGFEIEGSAQRFNGNEIPAAEGEHVIITVEFNTWTKYTILITETELYMVSSDMNYGLKYVLPENSLGYDEFTDFVTDLQNPMTGKPVIYLYPEKETEVSVKLDFDGKLAYTYPALNNGWNVLAKPDGTLTNLADGSTHYYLFWEGTARPEWTYEKGFVVKGSETESFLRENLAKMGLTPREYNDFITYWVPKMQENPYNLISFSGEEYSEIAKLTVNPKPDSVIRIHMMWKALDEPIEIEPQVLPVYKREGFTLVEWGGTELY